MDLEKLEALMMKAFGHIDDNSSFDAISDRWRYELAMAEAGSELIAAARREEKMRGLLEQIRVALNELCSEFSLSMAEFPELRIYLQEIQEVLDEPR